MTRACSANNERGIAIIFGYPKTAGLQEQTQTEKKLRELMKGSRITLTKNVVATNHENHTARRGVYIQASQYPQFLKIINQKLHQRSIVSKLEKRIQELNATGFFAMPGGKAKKVALENLKEQIAQDHGQDSPSQIFETWRMCTVESGIVKTNGTLIREHRGLFGWLLDLFGVKTATSKLMDDLFPPHVKQDSDIGEKSTRSRFCCFW